MLNDYIRRPLNAPPRVGEDWEVDGRVMRVTRVSADGLTVCMRLPYDHSPNAATPHTLSDLTSFVGPGEG